MGEALSEESKLAEAGYPRNLYSAAVKSQYRQGDLCYGYFHQLRSNRDAVGPGPKDPAVVSPKVPYLGEYRDVDVDIPSGPRLTLRVWAGWVMVLEQSCELIAQDAQDSRLQVAPVVFRTQWDGDHWSYIRQGTAPGYFYLPAMSESDLKRFRIKGWLPDTPAAVAMKSATPITPSLAGSSRFGLSNEMRGLLQARLVDFWSVRGWRRAANLDTLVGKTIKAIFETDEKHPGPGRIVKVLVSDDDDDDEITVGMVFRG
jgi:hypothetical protein